MKFDLNQMKELIYNSYKRDKLNSALIVMYVAVIIVLYVLVLPSSVAYSTIMLLVLLLFPLSIWLIIGKNVFLKRFVISWLILVFFATIGTYSIGYFLIELVNLNPQILKVGSISDWIGFAGAIFGSTTTLIAVAFTLFYESTETRNSRMLATLPLLNVDHKYIEDEKLDLVGKSVIQEIRDMWGEESIIVFKKISSNILIANISSNLIRDMRIRDIFIKFSDGSVTSILEDDVFFGIVLPNSKVTFSLNMKLIFERILKIKNSTDIDNIYFTLVTEIEYFDLSKSQNEPYNHQFYSELRLILVNQDIAKKNESKATELNHIEDYYFLSKSIQNDLDLSRFDINKKK